MNNLDIIHWHTIVRVGLKFLAYEDIENIVRYISEQYEGLALVWRKSKQRNIIAAMLWKKNTPLMHKAVAKNLRVESRASNSCRHNILNSIFFESRQCWGTLTFEYSSSCRDEMPSKFDRKDRSDHQLLDKKVLRDSICMMVNGINSI